MTGSVSNETQPATKNTGKTDESGKISTSEKTHGPSTSLSTSPNTSKSLLSPLAASTPKKTGSLQAAGGPSPRKPLRTNRSASSIPMDDGGSSLARHGRAQSVLTLYTGDEDERGFLSSASVLNAPMSRHRRGRSEVRGCGYGTMERATSYSNLASRPHFRSANSTRPPPAPPCTTTHLDFCRHPVNSANPHGARVRTPRRNNPHPVGLHFQSPYNRDGKVSACIIYVLCV